ncbi:MAG: glycosyltransferase family 4 protein [Hyphomonas sp.]|nr:glycosyltransferase family 4 protein [Hyphomonas sp.]
MRLLGMDPAEHFLRFGWLLNRKPSKDFDPDRVPGLEAFLQQGQRNPLVAYIEQHGEGGVLLKSRGASNGAAVTKPAGVNGKHPAPKPAPSARPSGPRNLGAEQADYDLLVTEFDAEYYVRRYQDIARSSMDPALHFLRHGGFELRNPGADFDTKYYVNQNPDVKDAKVNPFLHYLKSGRAEGRQPTPLSPGNPHYDQVAGMLGFTPSELGDRISGRKRDIRERLMTGELGEMIAKAEKLDPLVKHVWLAALDPGISPIRSAGWTQQMAALHQMQEQAGWRRAKVAVLIPWVHVSGAVRIAGHLAMALAEIFGPDEVIIVQTENSEVQFPEWFPDGARHIDFAAAAQGLDGANRERLLVEFLRSLKLDHVFNVNSRTFWNALEHFGVALSKSMKLHSYFFCNEKNIYGDWVGYPVRMYHKFADILDSVICDSHFLANELQGRFLVPPMHGDRLRVLSTPIDVSMEPVAPARRPANQRPKVFWAGRFDRQKRVDVAYAIAAAMPDVDFHFWGKQTLDKGFEKLKKPDNVKLEGVYQKFTDLPLAECDAWLYTAEWDGVPNMLIEVATAAVPLVGSIAGGTGEVLVEGLSWPVNDIEDVDDYVAGLRRAIENPVEVRADALKLRQVVQKRHAKTAYEGAVRALIDRETPNG